MLCEKAITLIKELDRNPDTLPPYNVSLIHLKIFSQSILICRMI